MTTRLMAICDSCVFKHVLTEYGAEETCDAYPDGIPVEILLGGEDHRQPREGDGGVQYALAPGREDLLDQWADRRDREDDGSR